MKRYLRAAVGVLAAGALALLVYFLFTSPTNSGRWKGLYERLASAEIVGDQVAISNFRRARYNADGEPENISWEDRRINLSTLQDVWYGISVFAEPGLAHTFLSFDFGDGDPVVISVEARQRPDQEYGVIAGLLDRFHLTYVIADERDIIGLRTHLRRDEVFFQPLSIDRQQAVALFRDMLQRANSLVDQPEFYNTLTSNCTNSLLRDTEFPAWRRYLDWRILLPGYSDRIAYDFGILDQRYSLGDLRAAAHIDPAAFSLEAADISALIRKDFRDKLPELAVAPALPNR
jgi:hypothetical protein